MRRAAAGVVLVLALGACAPGRSVPPAPTGSAAPNNDTLDTVEVSFGDAPGDSTVEAEVADSHDERVLGLMNRERLGADAGMLFVFPAASSGGFWMKNTLIPLSIAYMEKKDETTYEVVAILDMEPCPPATQQCPSYPPGRTYDATLEVNKGWFDDHGVEVGAAATLDRAVEAEAPS